MVCEEQAAAGRPRRRPVTCDRRAGFVREKFGFIYLVVRERACADDLLADCQARLASTPASSSAPRPREQAKIRGCASRGWSRS